MDLVRVFQPAPLLGVFHSLFNFAFWQALALGWLVFMGGAFLVDIAVGLREIKQHLGPGNQSVRRNPATLS